MGDFGREESVTREEILAMKPGRELDALVGEFVFGFKREKAPKDYNGQNGGTDVLVPLRLSEFNYPPKGKIPLWFFCEKWSTGISAAWEVLEKIDSPYIIASTEDGDTAWVHFGNEGNAAIGYPPEAICKAALLAVMEAKKA